MPFAKREVELWGQSLERPDRVDSEIDSVPSSKVSKINLAGTVPLDNLGDRIPCVSGKGSLLSQAKCGTTSAFV